MATPAHLPILSRNLRVMGLLRNCEPWLDLPYPLPILLRLLDLSEPLPRQPAVEQRPDVGGIELQRLRVVADRLAIVLLLELVVGSVAVGGIELPIGPQRPPVASGRLP